MAEFSMPWPGTTVGDAGPYSATEWDGIWEVLYGSGLAPYNDRGVIRNWSNELEVTDGGANTADVDAGAGLVHGKFYRNTAGVNVNIPNSVGAWREDLVCLRSDWVAQTIRIYRHANPADGVGYPAPTQIDGTTWEIPLAAVRINAAGAITLITDLRQWVCDLMHPAPAVGVYHNAAQNIVSGAPTILAFNSEEFDNGLHFGGQMHDNAVNNSRLTCFIPGKYQITANLEFAGHAVGFRMVILVLNGITNIAGQSAPTIGAATNHKLTATRLYDLVATDYVEAEVLHTAGAGLNVVYVAECSPYFQMVKVAD